MLTKTDSITRRPNRSSRTEPGVTIVKYDEDRSSAVVCVRLSDASQGMGWRRRIAESLWECLVVNW